MSVEKCIQCGICKVNCPIFKVILKESVSPRGLTFLAKKEIPTPAFYYCNLCKACEQECPLSIQVTEAVIELREKLKQTKETKANKKMISNLKAYRNPYGKLEENEKPTTFYY